MLLAFVLAAACGKNHDNTGGGGQPPPPGPLGSGNITQSTSVANGPQFVTPLDAALSPDGSQVYFVAVQPGSNPGGPALFSVKVAGGTPSALSVGGSIVAPFGVAVSSDGSTIYLADAAAQTMNDKGAVLSIPSGGGALTTVAGTEDYSPRAIAIAKVGGSDNLYFIGDDKADGVSGVFKLASGSVSPVIKSGNPSGIAAASDGTVYVLDGGTGQISRVAPNATTSTAVPGTFQSGSTAFPAGIALSQDEKALLVSGIDPATGNESIARVDIASGSVTRIAAGLMGQEPGGLHRAANADVYSFVDVGAGSSGTVYLLK